MKYKSDSHYILGLNGIRAIAITMIFILHAYGHSGSPDVFIDFFNNFKFKINSLIYFGEKGVDLFLILSGFLLSLHFWDKITKKIPPIININLTIKQRLLRIYPAYFIAIIIYALFHDLNHPFFSRLIQIMSHLLLIHNFSEVTIHNPSTPLWYIATQFQLYFALPIIFLVIEHFIEKGWSLFKIIVTLFISTGLIGILFYKGAIFVLKNINLDKRIISINGNVLRHSPFVCLVSFFTGVIFSYFYIYLRNKNFNENNQYVFIIESLFLIDFILIMIISIFGIKLIGVYPSYWPGLQILFGTIILLISLSNFKFGIATILELYPIRFVGTISFSFYLYHDIILWNVYNRVEPFLGKSGLNTNLFKGILAYAITVFVSWISYELIEKQFTKYLGNYWKVYGS